MTTPESRAPVEVLDDAPVTTLPGTSYAVTYYRATAFPQRLLTKSHSGGEDHDAPITQADFHGRAWRLANGQGEIAGVDSAASEGAGCYVVWFGLKRCGLLGRAPPKRRERGSVVNDRTSVESTACDVSNKPRYASATCSFSRSEVYAVGKIAQRFVAYPARSSTSGEIRG